MNISNGPVRPIPTDTDPAKTVCLQIDVPDDRVWIAALYDAIYQLTYWFAWDRDDAHTGAIIAKRWLKALDTLRICKEVQAPSGCPDPGEDYLIRQNPDNPCLIETSANGTNWCTLIDLSLCLAPTDQPGSGARQPLGGGGEACYHGKLNAAQSWLVPTVVNTGDVLTFDNIQGAGTDGSGHWYCPDGQIFFAGACVGSLSFDGADPAPAIHHMAILAKIGAAYYDITAGPITVPGGITAEQVTLQVNDSALANNAGDYNLDVCVTNNATVQFTHHFDFRLSQYGFVIAPWSGATNAAWVPGTGFTVSQPGPVVTHSGALDIGLNNAHPLAHCQLRFVGTATDGANGQYLFQQTATFPPPALGEFYSQTPSGAIDFSHDFAATLTKFGLANDLGATIGATGTITDCYVTADGVDPF